MAKIPKCGRLSRPAPSLVNFRAHYKIVGLYFLLFKSFVDDDLHAGRVTMKTESSTDGMHGGASGVPGGSCPLCPISCPRFLPQSS